MGFRLAKQVLLVIVAGLSFWLTVESWAQSSKPLQGTVPAGDPALVRQKNLKELLSQAREQLMYNHNPEAAKEKCQQALAIDPDNAEAHFFLAQAERQLKGEALMGARSPVSALPDPAKMSEAVARSRPTTTIVVLPSDRAGTRTAAQVMRRAVVDSKETYVAPQAVPVWLNRRYLIWAVAALGGVAAIAMGATVYSRFFPGKRRRGGLVPASEETQPTPKAVFEPPEGVSTLGVAASDDFPIGLAAPISATAAAARKSPVSKGDAEVDYWEDRSQKGRGGSAITAVVEGKAAPGEEEEKVETLPAGAVFGDEELKLAPPKAAAAAQPSKPGKVARPTTSSAATRPVSPQPATASAAPQRPASPAKPTPKATDKPSSLDGISIQSPVSTDFDVSDTAAGEERLPLEEAAVSPEVQKKLSSARDEVESIPFSLDVPLDETQTDAGEELEEPQVSDLLKVSEPEETASIRLDEDFPLTEATAPTSPMPAGDTMPFDLHEAVRTESVRPGEPSSQAVHDEILISSGSRRTSDRTADLADEEVSSESTMVDAQARHKAIFQDQLARGIAAMEKNNWKDAVKYLSVAHAMNPNDNYTREKLREAHEKRGSETG
jgi:hypothetical protein